jgi:toxin CcdB
MRRYEVWQLTIKDKNGDPRLVMILQSEKIDHLSTVVTAPLRPKSEDAAIPGLTPQVEIAGTRYSVLIPFMAAIEKKHLQSLVHYGQVNGYEIDRAIDRLFMGI